MDAVESETTIYIMTERVRPLSSVLPQYSSKKSQEREDWLLWGLYRISVCRSSSRWVIVILPLINSLR